MVFTDFLSMTQNDAKKRKLLLLGKFPVHVTIYIYVLNQEKLYY
jgi:hypothetical protein